MRHPAARLFLVLLLGQSVGMAQEEEATGVAEVAEDANRVEARRLASLGDQAFTIGRCDKAIPLWEQANGVFYAPTILFRIARCQALQGKVVDATKTLEAMVGGPVQPDEPPAFATARQQAAKELPNLRARIGRLRVEVDTRGLAVVPAVWVDMKLLPEGVRSVEVDPGEHVVRVDARDDRWEATVEAEEGKERVVRVALGEVQRPLPPRTQRTVGLVIGGVGLAALATGGYFGYSASSTSTELDGVCGANRKACPPDRQDDIDRVKTHALVADFTLGAGATLLVAGAIVVLTEKVPERETPRIEFYSAGLGGGLRGSF
ncbi:MAG: hypothetical protein CVU63_10700 [Deltaproteobacteria bacterium HGW-Deltaproteobacteria-20]|nr:MAG: hypothetical protein CVU63_10700 [Deltaproteobacteria bacterium HGW-Deltaproteobacteria-20]